MLIKSLELANFRNHTYSKIALSPGTNIFIGGNAQGKTNLLEAIYLTCVGRAWRTSRDIEMIKFDQSFARVKAKVNKRFGDCTVEVTLSTKKFVKINDIPIAKMGELMGTINCVFFSPDELRLIKEAPADRRRFIDIDISQIDKNYFYALLRYNKILQQRNALLKTYPAGDGLKCLDIWDAELAKAGAYIIEKRIAFVKQLIPEAQRIHTQLTNGEHIEIFYSAIDDSIKNVPRGTCCEILLAQLQHAREKDLRLKTTTVGPHRDDLRITINEKDVRSFASQGQQRTAALSLKLAELEIFRLTTGEVPILLLDDVMSELDSARQQKLLQIIRNCQSIITATDFAAVDSSVRIFKISQGKII